MIEEWLRRSFVATRCASVAEWILRVITTDSFAVGLRMTARATVETREMAEAIIAKI